MAIVVKLKKKMALISVISSLETATMEVMVLAGEMIASNTARM